MALDTSVQSTLSSFLSSLIDESPDIIEYHSKPFIEISHFLSIGIFSYLGVGVRILLNHLWNYIFHDSPLLNQLGSNYLLANIVGCIFMGFILRLRGFTTWRLFNFLHVGLTTGFCGCCTTFSTWNINGSKYLAQGEISLFFYILLLQLPLASSSLHFGYDIGELFISFILTKKLKYYINDHWYFFSLLSKAEDYLKHYKKYKENDEVQVETTNTLIESLSSISNQYAELNQDVFNLREVLKDSYILLILSTTFFIMTIIFWILAFLLPNQTHKNAFIAVTFAPFGAWIRFFFSLFNHKFPLFTLIPNILACIISGVIDIVSTKTTTTLDFTFWAKNGLVVGFCGSLSTLSTFINELQNLSRKEAYVYGIISVLIAQLFSTLLEYCALK